MYRLTDANDDRYYLSTTTGALLKTVDARVSWHRWVFLALHRGDFHALLRSRPLWDTLMLFLLSGTTLGAGTGAYLGVRRLIRSK